jgi:hypothetical protein
MQSALSALAFAVRRHDRPARRLGVGEAFAERKDRRDTGDLSPMDCR